MEEEPTPRIIPLFPLPTTVLFPETYLPLHIFEPRYREMVRVVLDGSREIGMILLKEKWEEKYYGNPPIHSIGCMGKIVQVQRLKDGRFNLVLAGKSRFRVSEEVVNKSFRQAWVEMLPPPDSPGSLPLVVRTGLEKKLEEYGRVRRWEDQIMAVLKLRLDDRKLVNVLSAELDLTPVEKQFLLESEDLVQHCRRLIDFLGFRALERSGKRADRPGRTDS